MKYLAVTIVAVVLAVSGALGLSKPDSVTGAGTDNSRPADPQAIPVGAARDLDAFTASLQQRLRDVPEDDQGWATLGLVYVEQARVNGDAGLYTKAEQAVARSLELEPDDNALGHAADAAVESARHDFAGALDRADTALGVDAYDVTALAVRVDALNELGRYDEAWQAAMLADSRRPGVPTATRYAYQLELRGDLPGSAKVLRRQLANATHLERAGLLTLLADLDRRSGRLDEAEANLREAQRESPGFLPALVSSARLNVASGRLDEAVATWSTVVRRLPNPEYLIELGELHLALGDTAAADEQFAVVETMVTLLGEGGVDTDLETALFQADHGSADKALADARAVWLKQPSIHSADALAWALHRTGDDRAALGLARQATRLGTVEARLWLHRGRIEAALGDDRSARISLQRGLASDPGVSPWQAEQARAVLRGLR